MLEWTRDVSRTYKTLKWLILPMSSIGWYKDRFTRKSTKFLQIINIFLSVIVNISCVYVVAETNQESSVSLSITGILNSIGVTIILIFGSLYIPPRFNKFVRFSDRIKDTYPFYATSGNVNSGVVLSGLIYLIFATINIGTLLNYYGMGSHYAYSFLSFSVTTSSLTCIFHNYQYFVMMSMIHCLCWILKTEAVEISKELDKMVETVPSESQIEEVKKRYVDITDLTEMADNILYPMVFAVLTLSSFITCFLMNALLMKNQTEMAFITYVTLVTLSVYNIAFLLTQGCMLHEALTACIALPSKFCSSKMTDKITVQTVLLMETMKNREVGLSYMKMFILNKPAVLTVIGTLMTYIIIVMQFQPD